MNAIKCKWLHFSTSTSTSAQWEYGYLELYFFLLIQNQCHSSNKRTGPIKRIGWNFDKNQISVRGGILIKILEYRVKTGNFINNKKDF